MRKPDPVRSGSVPISPDHSSDRISSALRSRRTGSDQETQTSNSSPDQPAYGPASYHRMPRAQKQAHALADAREPHVRCPACEVATSVRDLVAHVRERCPGRAAPHPHAAWVTWQEARAMGVSKATMHRLASIGAVRTTGPLRRRRYLLRDLVLELARLAAISKGRAALETPTPPGGGQGTPAGPAGAGEELRSAQPEISSSETGDQ